MSQEFKPILFFYLGIYLGNVASSILMFFREPNLRVIGILIGSLFFTTFFGLVGDFISARFRRPDIGAWVNIKNPFAALAQGLATQLLAVGLFLCFAKASAAWEDAYLSEMQMIISIVAEVFLSIAFSFLVVARVFQYFSLRSQ